MLMQNWGLGGGGETSCIMGDVQMDNSWSITCITSESCWKISRVIYSIQWASWAILIIPHAAARRSREQSAALAKKENILG